MDKEEKERRCPVCGYTAQDKKIHGGLRLGIWHIHINNLCPKDKIYKKIISVIEK